MSSNIRSFESFDPVFYEIISIEPKRILYSGQDPATAKDIIDWHLARYGRLPDVQVVRIFNNSDPYIDSCDD